jgi:transcriptional regulator with XRE-family HTH domain
MFTGSGQRQSAGPPVSRRSRSLCLYAYRITPMEIASSLVAEARHEAGASLRELARLAGVSFTTISRIEAGDIDPTVGMLRRILAAAGRDLRLATDPLPTRRSLAELANAVSNSPSGERPDWTRLRALLDYLALHPDEVSHAISSQPHTDSRLMKALLAGIAEKLADDHGLLTPGWTWTAPKIKPEWSLPGTPRMRANQRANTPRQLLKRGLVIDETSLWRDRKTVGV